MLLLILKILKILLIAYLALIVLTYLFQDKGMFHPRASDDTPQSVGLAGFEEVELTTADNKKMYGWYKKPDAGKKTIVYFHGNAEGLAHNADLFALLGEGGNGVFAPAYRGFGKSEGKPSEVGFYEDARTAIKFLLKSQPEDSIIVYGRSIGTGVAVQMATEFKFGGVVLLSPYTSIPDLAADIYWYLPVKPLRLVKYKFDSLSKIKNVHAPLLIIHGEKDMLIPIANAKILYEAANIPKKFVTIAESDHIEFEAKRLADEIRPLMNGNLNGSAATTDQ